MPFRRNSKRRRVRNSHLTVSQCEDAIQKWLHESKSGDPVHAFDFAAVKWTKCSSPAVRHHSGVEKDFLTDIPLRRGSPSSGRGVPVHSEDGACESHGTGVHVARMMAPIRRKLGPSPSEKGCTSVGSGVTGPSCTGSTSTSGDGNPSLV